MSGSDWEKTLKPLIGKRVESVRVDEYGVVFITAAGLGGRVVAKIGDWPRRAPQPTPPNTQETA